MEPQHKIGPAASRMAALGRASERFEGHRAVARANGEKLPANPALAIDAIIRAEMTIMSAAKLWLMPVQGR